MKSTTSFAWTALLGFALLGCGSGSGYSALSKSRNRWDKQRPAHYSYRYSFGGFANRPGSGLPWTIEVTDPTVTSVTFAGDGTADSQLPIADAPTIDALFGTIQRALDQGDVEVTAEYEPNWGFPTHASFTVGSEGDSFSASDLVEK